MAGAAWRSRGPRHCRPALIGQLVGIEPGHGSVKPGKRFVEPADGGQQASAGNLNRSRYDDDAGSHAWLYIDAEPTHAAIGATG
ncbi:hypothetical protein [Micromonospora sp. NPDC005305]|uniref:hypothetical protein n=1 Tax=Micromonospora sp. NPDC005305 TaxID=3156875 RepID=UPI0033AED794